MHEKGKRRIPAFTMFAVDRKFCSSFNISAKEQRTVRLHNCAASDGHAPPPAFGNLSRKRLKLSPFRCKKPKMFWSSSPQTVTDVRESCVMICIWMGETSWNSSTSTCRYCCLMSWATMACWDSNVDNIGMKSSKSISPCSLLACQNVWLKKSTVFLTIGQPCTCKTWGYINKERKKKLHFPHKKIFVRELLGRYPCSSCLLKVASEMSDGRADGFQF